MEKIKKLADLNTKAWYRGLKVIYIFFAIFCYSIAVGVAFIHTAKIFDLHKEYRQGLITTNTNVLKIRELKDLGHTTQQIRDSIYGEPKESVPIRMTEEEYNTLFDINTPQKPVGIFWLILYISLYFFVAYILSEFPKRIFYYIYFGNIKLENGKKFEFNFSRLFFRKIITKRPPIAFRSLIAYMSISSFMLTTIVFFLSSIPLISGDFSFVWLPIFCLGSMIWIWNRGIRVYVWKK